MVSAGAASSASADAAASSVQKIVSSLRITADSGSKQASNPVSRCLHEGADHGAVAPPRSMILWIGHQYTTFYGYNV